MTCAWEEILPGSTIGSRRRNAVLEWQGMRQKASADPERSAAATEKVVVDFMADTCDWQYQGLSRGSAVFDYGFEGGSFVLAEGVCSFHCSTMTSEYQLAVQ